MNRTVWRSWAIVGAVIAVLAVAGVHLTVAWLTHEPPNYSQIEEGLYVGGFVREPPKNATAVLNLNEREDPYQVAVHRWEPIQDSEPAPGRVWLGRQVRFIEDQRKEGRTVFVHCQNGVSRSGLVVTAYLMARHGWSRDEALAFVRSRRPMVRPNPAFLRLLQEWEQSLKLEPEGLDRK